MRGLRGTEETSGTSKFPQTTEALLSVNAPGTHLRRPAPTSIALRSNYAVLSIHRLIETSLWMLTPKFQC